MKQNFKFILVFLFLALTMSFVSAHAIKINFYDESSLSAIPTVTITDANGSTYTSDINGLWTTDLVGAKSFDISKTGYATRPFEFYFNADANYNVLLNPTGLDSNIGFIVKDSNNNLWTNKYLMFRQVQIGNYDITKISFTRTLNVSAKETKNRGTSFKPDGTEMYIIGSNSDSVHQYTLGTAWDISTASFTRSFSVSAKEMDPNGLTFKPDGTEMYIIGPSSNSVYQYTLGTAWNISTASFTRSFSVSTQSSNSYEIKFKPDGKEMYLVASGSTIFQYTLSTAWNISTATITRELSVSSQDTSLFGMDFKSDGTIMYLSGFANRKIYQYTLSTAWDISTATYLNQFTFTELPNGHTGITINPTGLYIYFADATLIYQYSFKSLNNNIINSLLTSSPGTATASLLANGDYNALLYDATGNLVDTYEKTTVTVNKPKNEITLGAISPYDITVGGLLGYSLTNQSASSVSFNIFAGTEGFYYFSVVDYNVVPADRKYLPRQYFTQVPMGTGYESALTYQPYLLLETDAVVPKITVLDQLNKPIGDVDIFISRSISNVVTIVESGKTTSTGNMSFSAYPLEYYYINVIYNGIDKGTFRVQPRESTDNFIIVIDTSDDVVDTGELIITADFSGTPKVVNIDDTNINADISITQSLNQATSYNLYLIQNNVTKVSTSGAISGLVTSIDYDFDSSVVDRFNNNLTLKLVVNYPDGNQTFYYTITATKNAKGLMYFAPQIINDIGQPLGIILAILITAILLASLTFSGLNISPTAITILGVLILGVFMFLGWLDTGITVLGFDIARFFYVLMAIAMIYFMMRGEQYA